MKLKTESDSIRALVIDYLCLLELDALGELNDDFSMKEIVGQTVTALHAAIKKADSREAKALEHILSIRVST